MSLSNSFLKNIKTRIKSLPKSMFLKVFHVKREAPRCVRLSGVLTVEAALVMPCLLCFFISVLFFFRILQVQLEVQQAVDDTARKLAVYMAEGEDAANWRNKAAVKALLMKELSHSKYAASYIKGGIAGISLSKSEWSGKDVNLQASCRLVCPIRLFGLLEVRIKSKAVCRKWIGWGTSGESGKDADIWVYIAQTGSVYHKTEECTHLMLSIQSVEESKLAVLRNEDGGRYKKCSLCHAKGNQWNRVYITNQGDRYHYDLNCSKIKRTVSRIRLSEVGARKPCSRCKPARIIIDIEAGKDYYVAEGISVSGFGSIGIPGLQKKDNKFVYNIVSRNSGIFNPYAIRTDYAG